jgi:serine/threonine-protein kinase
LEFAPQPPAAFGRYRVMSRLGAGAMAAVFLAVDESLDREVAIKVLRPLVAFGEPPPALRERFRREARAIAALTHPSVVRIYDQGIEGDLPYVVMELVRGPTLAELIRRGPLPLGELRTLGIQVASALGAAHDAGIIHRDVKPSNILQAGPSSWKLADFGIAQVADSSLTLTGQFLGTPAFAAPEALEGSAVGPAADVYSLAATLYAALAGEPPHGNVHLAQALVAISRGRPAPLAARRPDLPPHIALAIDRALSHAPSERPSAGELASELAVDEAAVSPGPPASPPARTGAARRGRAPALALAAAAALLVAAVALTSRSGPPAPRAEPVATAPAATAPAEPVAPPAPAEPDAAPALPPVEPGTPPPWYGELPAELTRPGDPPEEIELRWRAAYAMLQEGDWASAEEQLEAIAAARPADDTARRWLAWIRAARSDPARFGVVVLED